MIPKIIHHIWPSNTQAFADPRMIRWRGTWLRHHPDWTFMFWRIGDLPLEKFSELGRKLILNPAYNVIVKSDIIRYELLYLLGGFYSDTDIECFRSFEEFREDDGFFIFCGGNVVWDCLIGIVPEASVMKECSNITNAYFNTHDPESFNLCQIAAKYCEKYSVPILASNYPIQPKEVIWNVQMNSSTSRKGDELVAHHRSSTWPTGYLNMLMY